MKTVKKYLKRYFIDAMGSMALGLFASLLMGTILSTLGKYIGAAEAPVLAKIGTGLTAAGNAAKAVTGAVIAIAISYRLKADPLVVFSTAAVGYLANSMGAAGLPENATAGPAGVFFAVIVAAEVGGLVSKKTKVDILVTPLVTILSGYLTALLLCPAISYGVYYLGSFINTVTEIRPLLMGVVLAMVVGIILTLPISSAAICAMVGIAGLAGGAATVGCCAQMVGFAVISFRENKWNGLIAQGLGTSMLQMGNICKKPVIWVAPTLAGGVCGALSTTVFQLKCNGIAAGMGTCGMVGPLGILEAMQEAPDWHLWVGMPLLCIVLPAVLSLLFNGLLRRLGLVKTGDMLLEL